MNIEKMRPNLPNSSRHGLIAWGFIFSYFFLMPRPDMSGFHYAAFLFLFFCMTTAVMLFGIQRKDFLFQYDYVLVAPFLYLLSSSISMSINHETLRVGAMAEMVRPFFLLIAYVFSYSTVKNIDPNRVLYCVGNLCKLIIFVQLILASIQAFHPDFFNLLWSAKKTTGISGIFRVTGSMVNPNMLAFVTVILSSFIFSMRLTKRNLLWLALAGFLILLSASRTNLLLWPFILSLNYGLRQVGSIKVMIKQIILVILVFFLFFLILAYFSTSLRYASQIFLIFKTWDLSSVNAFAARLKMWDEALKMFNDTTLTNYIWGFGAPETLRFVDNDYIYVLAKHGLFGLGVHFFSIMCLLSTAWRSIANPAGRWLVCVVVATSISGLSGESLMGWLYGTVVFFIAGTCKALENSLRFREKHLELAYRKSF